MFTGLIEAIGTVKSTAPGDGGKTVGVRVPFKPAMGESIAVKGACVTVSGLLREGFFCFLSPETLARTTMRSLKAGDNVHIERALTVGGRFGGHIVSGHIDGVGTVVSKKKEKDTIVLDVKVPAGLQRFMVGKGSVAMDGVSLTVNNVGGDVFSVTLIPFTLKMTMLGKLGKGDEVNLEIDLISKLVVQTVENMLGKGEGPSAPQGAGDGVTRELLAKAGFIK
ncbi:MAG: riboflavin synthase [Pseudomonadota bacterium]